MTPQPRRDKHGVPICPWPNGQVTCGKECKHLALNPLKSACFPALRQDYERMRVIEEERDDARVLVAAEELKHIIAITELRRVHARQCLPRRTPNQENEMSPIQKHWYTVQPTSFNCGYDAAKQGLEPFKPVHAHSKAYPSDGLRRMHCGYLHGFRYGTRKK